jgi:hypothetical protein
MVEQKVSERFKRALQDLKEVAQSGGLVQDDTPKKIFDTVLALVGKIMKIGIQEGKLSEDEVRSHIRTVLEPVAAQADEIEKHQTIFDMISIILGQLKARKINEKSHEDIEFPDREQLKSNPVFPHDKTMNNLMYNTMCNKYFECTEQQRRSITRSDEEFCMIIRSAITVLSGFGNNEQEAFGNILNLEIPRMPRGNESLWDPRGDPMPETPEGFDEVNERLDYLLGITFTELHKLYPQIHKKIMEYFEMIKQKGQPAKMVLNTSHQKIKTLPSLYYRCKEIDDFTEFDDLMLPLIIDATIIQRLTEKDSFVNRNKRESIRKDLLAKINQRLEDK